MTDLREAFGTLSLRGVETFIASGNVIFQSRVKDTAALEKKIEKELRKSLGYPVSTFIRSAAEVQEIAKHEPFARADMDAHPLYIAFLAASPDAEAHRKVMACRSAVDEFRVRDREVFWLCRAKLSESEFSGSRLEKIVGMPATIRNVTTVRRLAAKFSADDR